MLEGMSSLQGVEIFELNERLLSADNYMNHSTLSRGARLLGDSRTRDASAPLVELSRYHGVRLKKRIEGRSLWESKDISTLLAKVMLSNANRAFPWPDCSRIWLGSRRSGGIPYSTLESDSRKARSLAPRAFRISDPGLSHPVPVPLDG